MIKKLRAQNAALKREPAKLQAKLDQLFKTYEWQVRAGEGGNSDRKSVV